MKQYQITKLSEENTKLSFVTKNKFPAKYLELREKYWELEIKKHGKNLWNGEVYTIENIKKSDDGLCEIKIGVCEYKDIILKINKGPSSIIKMFGKENFIKDAITTVLPFTTDNKILFGVVSSNTIQKSGSLDQIGGTLNKNEKEIKLIDDIADYTSMEVEEEIGLKQSEYKLSLHSLNYYYTDGRYRFLYLCKLPKSSDYYKNIVINEELAGFKFMNKQELIQYSGLHTNRIPYCQQNIEKIFSDYKKRFKF